MLVTVIIPTHNPHPERLAETLNGLQLQTLADEDWEVVIVDNASFPPLEEEFCRLHIKRSFRLVSEAEPGLSSARRCGLLTATTDLVVFSDDDNVLAPDYLENTLRHFDENQQIGAAGGKSIPVYEEPVPEWFYEGLAPLGCRDLGEKSILFEAANYARERSYPACAPIGAGMVIRKQAMKEWLENVEKSDVPDRKGNSLSSAGDCDMVLYALDAGWSVAYWPDLILEHLIPAERLTRVYLSAVSRCAYRDFIRVLDIHGIRPWPRIAKWTVPLRSVKAFFQIRGWQGAVCNIKWHSTIGNYLGRSALL